MNETMISIAPYVFLFIMQSIVLSIKVDSDSKLTEMNMIMVDEKLVDVNLLEFSANMRNIAHSYYDEAFIDTLSLILNWVSITLLFENIRVFAIFWRTLKNMYALVNVSFAYFIILCSGLTFANMAFNMSNDGRYLSFINSFA